ncbi:MAG: hypothetical protein ACLP1X_01770 [Polyangiaceae bacterium]|jgi:hypothetical protein
MNHLDRKAAWLVGAMLATAFVVTGGLVASACSSSSSGNPVSPFVDSGTGPSDAAPDVPRITTADAGADGQALMPWPPPGTSPCSNPDQCPGDPGANAVYVTISGEENALTAYPFPPDNFQTDTYMFDGWIIQIKEYIVSVGNVRLWSNPNADPTNQGDLSHMTQVAHLTGPFVVDLHKGGQIIGQGGAPEESTPIGVILNQNDNNGAAFDPTTSYGFGFSTVQASYDAYNVNLDQGEAADFAYMVQQGYSVMYVGTATWNGNASTYGCTQTNAGAGPDAGLLTTADGGTAATYVDGGYDFTKMPATMTFRLGFGTPTNYENCQNMTSTLQPLQGEDYARGLQTSTSQSTIAQVTVHMDHPFWESFAENSPIHWDDIAAQYVGETNPMATVEDMKGVPFYAFTDKTGTPLPWRNCAGPWYQPPNNGQMSFSTLSVPVNPQAMCTGTIGQDYTKANCPAIRDYYDYIRYSQSTQGHLNSQGLCFIDRQYPAPAGGS